jgi:hypothetical protein
LKKGLPNVGSTTSNTLILDITISCLLESKVKMPEVEEIVAASTEMEAPFEEDVVSEDEGSDDSLGDVPGEEKKQGTPKDGDGITNSMQVVTKEDFSKYKTKVAFRLAKALEGMPTDNAYRSPDLVPLTTDFQSMRKKLRSLLVSAKAYQAATLKVQDARSKVSICVQLVSIYGNMTKLDYSSCIKNMPYCRRILLSMIMWARS